MLFFEVSKDTVAKVEKDLADPESTVFPADSVPASSVKNNMKDPTQPGAMVLFFEVSKDEEWYHARVCFRASHSHHRAFSLFFGLQSWPSRQASALCTER